MITTLYIRRIGDDPNAHILLQRLQAEGFQDLKHLVIEKVFRLEGVTPQQARTLEPLFCHPRSEKMTSRSSLEETNNPVLEVGYQRAVTDPELPSILRGAHALGVENLEWSASLTGTNFRASMRPRPKKS